MNASRFSGQHKRNGKFENAACCSSIFEKNQTPVVGREKGVRTIQRLFAAGS